MANTKAGGRGRLYRGGGAMPRLGRLADKSSTLRHTRRKTRRWPRQRTPQDTTGQADVTGGGGLGVWGGEGGEAADSTWPQETDRQTHLHAHRQPYTYKQACTRMQGTRHGTQDRGGQTWWRRGEERDGAAGRVGRG